MDANEINFILQERNYPPKIATIVAKNLVELSEPLVPLLNQWLDDYDFFEDFEVKGYSIKYLTENRGMNYVAALLTLDWLIKEPEAAIKSLESPIR